MARGYHRLSFRARHILRQFGKAKNITLQKLHLHELRHAISRKHHFKGPKGKPALGKPGLYQRLSRKGRKLIARLRHSKSWQVQKQTVTELEREVQRGERIALARVKRADRWAQRGERIAKRTKERGTRFRKWAQRKQEPALARAERKQAARPVGARKPRLPERARKRVSGWRSRRARARVPAPLRPGYRAPRPSRARSRDSGGPLLARISQRWDGRVDAKNVRALSPGPRAGRPRRRTPVRSRTR